MTNDFPPYLAELVRQVAAGKTLAQAAEALGITRATAASYAERARDKLGVSLTRELPAAYFLATGDNPWPKG